MRTAFSLLPLLPLALAAWRDLATRTIPNRVPAAIVLIGLPLRAATGGVAGLAWSCAFALLLFAALAAVHARGILGGGDVKLAAAVGLGLPPVSMPQFLAATAISGGVLAAAHLSLRLAPRRTRPPLHAPTLRRIYAIERWRVARRGSLPYGIAIASGGAYAILGPLLALRAG